LPQAGAYDEFARTVGFGNNPIANLADIHQRIAFVLKAAAQLVHDGNRHRIEQAMLDIAAGRGVR
jgi:type IV secretory pathway VirB4 component